MCCATHTHVALRSHNKCHSGNEHACLLGSQHNTGTQNVEDLCVLRTTESKQEHDNLPLTDLRAQIPIPCLQFKTKRVYTDWPGVCKGQIADSLCQYMNIPITCHKVCCFHAVMWSAWSSHKLSEVHAVAGQQA